MDLERFRIKPPTSLEANTMDAWTAIMTCTNCDRILTHQEINQWPEPIETRWERTGHCDMCQFLLYIDPNDGQVDNTSE